MIPQFYKQFQHWGAQGTVWIYSDPHFGDAELKAGIRKRPSDEELLRMINSKVGRKDTFICLGDVGDIEFAKRIKGYKILICGNHDVGHSVYEEIFDEVYSGPVIVGEKIILSHEPLPGIEWALNIHGHDHSPFAKTDKYHFNVCADVIGYTPVHLNSLLKSGILSKIPSVHRITIDKATERKKKK
jgi:calcineurin-like phosphoesterase family protein